MTPDRLRLLKDINLAAKTLSWLIDQLVFEEEEKVRRRKAEVEHAKKQDQLDERGNFIPRVDCSLVTGGELGTEADTAKEELSPDGR